MKAKKRKTNIRFRKLFITSIVFLVGFFASVSFFLLKPEPIQSQNTQQGVTDARLQGTSIINSDNRVLLQCLTGTCTVTAKLFSSDAAFKCPKEGKKCTATITMSTGHNCTENVPLANLQIDGNTISEPGAITEMRLCNPNDANGNFDNLSSYTWVQTGITPGSHTANILITYNSTTATGIGFDHQTLVVNVYSSK